MLVARAGRPVGRGQDPSYQPVAAQPGTAVTDDDAGLFPVVIVLLAVLFNAVLSIINAHVKTLSMASVIGTELALVVAANLFSLYHLRRRMLPWHGMIFAIAAFAVIRAAITGSFEPKYVRDVLVIPTFLLLGMTTPAHRLTRLVVTLHVVVVGCVLFEAFFANAYSSLFEVRQYYIATRGFDDTAFWDDSSNLFVSATRPFDRFFGFIDLHRVSSVFMEPVSLGNYIVIVTAFLCANYHRMTWKTRLFLAIGNFIALVACDGRLATVTLLAIAAVSLVVPHLPRKIAVLYLPAAVVGAFLLAGLTDASAHDDNFLGRVAFCVKLLSRYDLMEWLGMSDRFIMQAFDSGIAYMITTQSIVGVTLFWLLFVLSSDETNADQATYLHAVGIYVVLTMLVSYSLFSIKTAALLWFIHGSLQRDLASRAAGAIRARPTRLRPRPPATAGAR